MEINQRGKSQSDMLYSADLPREFYNILDVKSIGKNESKTNNHILQ
jgi:hypothetical protein